MQVIKRYEPALNDELSLEIGEWVEVEEVFDDGWGVGVNLETAQYGAFPMDSLQQDKKKSGKRVQSMVASRAAAANGGGIMGTLGEYTTGVYDYLGWSSK